MTAIRNTDNVLTKVDVHGDVDINISDDGGLNGITANIRHLANSTIHVQNPARIIVTRFPGWMDLHPDAENIKRQFVFLIETHAENWTGFEIASTIAVAERAAGRDGQLAKAPTTRTVNPITPSASFKAIGEGVDINFWNYSMDVSIGTASDQRPDFGELVSVPDTWTMEHQSFDLLVYEPNSTYTRARWAMAIGGLFCNTPIPIMLENNVADSRKMREYTLTFEGGVYDASRPVVMAASTLEEALNLNKVKSSSKVAFFTSYEDDIDVDVDAGIISQIQSLTTA